MPTPQMALRCGLGPRALRALDTPCLRQQALPRSSALACSPNWWGILHLAHLHRPETHSHISVLSGTFRDTLVSGPHALGFSSPLFPTASLCVLSSWFWVWSALCPLPLPFALCWSWPLSRMGQGGLREAWPWQEPRSSWWEVRPPPIHLNCVPADPGEGSEGSWASPWIIREEDDSKWRENLQSSATWPGHQRTQSLLLSGLEMVAGDQGRLQEEVALRL